MRNVIFILLIFCFSLGCISKNIDNSQVYTMKDSLVNDKRDLLNSKNNFNIKIQYVDPAISSIVPIYCEDFESSFHNEINNLEIAIDSELLSYFIPSSEYVIDSRLKFSYLLNGKICKICLSSTGIFFIEDSNKYMENPQLYNRLKEIIPIWR